MNISDLIQQVISKQNISVVQKTPLSVWLYNFNDLDNNIILQNLKKHAVKKVFLSVNHAQLQDETSTYFQKIKSFIISAHQNNISIHAMTLEDPIFSFEKYHSKAEEIIGIILNYCKKQQNSLAAFDGIHLDVEPHILPEWTELDWGANEKIMQQYINLLKKTKSQITIQALPKPVTSQIKFELSSAIGWWYNEQAKAGNLPSGDAKILMAHLDFIVPMVYDGVGKSVSDIIQRVSDEIQEAPTMIGLDPKNFSTLKTLLASVEQLNNKHFYANKNYKYVCLFDYASLVALPLA